MAKIDIVIPYYEGAKWIGPCLKSLAVCREVIGTVIIVDNSPTRLERKLLEPIANLEIVVLEALPGVGFGRACNIGIDHCRRREGRDFLLILNQDTIVPEGCLKILWETLNNEPNAFAAAPVSFNYEGTEMGENYFHQYIGKNRELRRDLLNNQVRQSYSVPADGINAAAVLLRLSMLRELGGFDPCFHMYGEDNELFDRALAKGYPLLLVPSARLRHHHSLENYRKEFPGALFRGRTIRDIKTEEKPFRALRSFLLKRSQYYLKSLLRLRAVPPKEFASDLAVVKAFRQIVKNRDPKNLQKHIQEMIQKDLKTPRT